MDKQLYPVQFLKKWNIFLKKLRNPEFSLSELNYSFLLFSYPLVMPENYPREVLMKIVEVVIFLEIFDFFQKKIRFFKKSKKQWFFIFTISNVHNIHATEKIEREAVFFKYIFCIFRVPGPHFWKIKYFFKALATMAYPVIEC